MAANIYGELIRAQLQSSASDLTSPVAGIVYYNTTLSTAKYYNGAWKTIANINDAQTFLGKSTQTLLGFIAETATVTTGTLTPTSTPPKAIQRITTSSASLGSIINTEGALNTQIILVNASGGSITVTDDTGGATSILTGTGADISLAADACLVLVYDTASSRWRIIGGAGSGGGGGISYAAGMVTFLGSGTSADLAAAITDETGSGALVFATSPTLTSPTLVTPALGTPASGVLTSCTGLPIATGVSGLAAGVAAFLASGTSADLKTAITDETGSGALVFATSPTLVTPALGTPSSGVLTSCTGLPLTTGVTGTLGIVNGGTGVTSVTTGITAGAFAGWDANGNLSANNIVGDYATTATAAGTTTLTVSSKRVQFFTGATTQTVTLPVVTTLALGHVFDIRNLSTGVVTVQSSGANVILAMQPGESLRVTCILTTGTTAASWSISPNLALSPAATGATTIPSGTLAQRPTPVAGQLRLETDSNQIEAYVNGQWSTVGLNEQPIKNYLKPYSDARSLGTVTATTPNAAITATIGNFHASDSGAITLSTSTALRAATNYLAAITSVDIGGSIFFQFPAFALEAADNGKPISISFDVTGNTTSGDWDVVVVEYSASGSHIGRIPVAGIASACTNTPSAVLPTGTTTFNGFFVPSNGTSIYALRFRRLAGSAQPRIDTLFIGPQPIRVGSASTDPVSYTPTLGLSGLTGDGKWWREGAFLCVHGSAVYASAVSGSSLTVSIPSGLTIDTSALPTLNELVLGTVGGIDNGVAWAGGWVGYNTTTTVIIYAKTSTTYQYGTVTASAPFTLAAGDRFNWQFKVPIVGWSSNVTMADRAVESYAADDGSSDVFGPNGALVPNIGTSTGTTLRSFTFQETKQATDNYILEYNFGGNGWSQQNGIWNYIEGTGSYSYGMRGFWNSATTYVVQFGNGGVSPTNGWGAAGGTAWSTEFTNGDRFRVRRVSAGAQVGYPISSANIVGRVDGNAPATGMVGEELTGSQTSSTNFGTSGNYFDTCSVALTPGVWDLTGSVMCGAVGATVTAIEGFIGTVSGNNSTGRLLANNAFHVFLPNASMNSGGNVSGYRVNITATTTYYLKLTGNFSAGTPQYYAKIRAIRVA